MSSRTSVSSTYTDLSETARTILTTLCNTRDFSEVDRYVSEDVSVQHEDEPAVASRDAFVRRFSQALEHMPEFQIDVKEACVDESQLKVWVRSEITGLPNGVKKESIDMMTFNEEGMLVKSVDCQRVLGRRSDDD